MRLRAIYIVDCLNKVYIKYKPRLSWFQQSKEEDFEDLDENTLALNGFNEERDKDASCWDNFKHIVGKAWNSRGFENPEVGSRIAHPSLSG